MEAARVNRPDYRQSLAQAIARGVIKFVNVMGDRNLQLPGFNSIFGDSSPAPKPSPVAPPAPSGLAHDPANGNFKAAVPVSSTSPTAPISIHKSKKAKKPVIATPELSKPPEPGPVPAPSVAASPTPVTKTGTDVKPTGSTSGTKLNLTEPAAPAPSPGAEKAPPEPDEPPTVNIYPTVPTTPPSGSAPTTNAVPATSTPPKQH
jgi:hypothetical protein